MRGLILAATLFGIFACANAQAGPDASYRQMASLDTAAVSDEATLESEHQIGLTKSARRKVQKRLTSLGFKTKADGQFKEATRSAIAHRREEHGYPKTGFLNTAQHTALLQEGGSAREAHHSRPGATDTTIAVSAVRLARSRAQSAGCFADSSRRVPAVGLVSRPKFWSVICFTFWSTIDQPTQRASESIGG
jgi:peptidoglycan hydrolase-like protein with peptidoglycan-binding domain